MKAEYFRAVARERVEEEAEINRNNSSESFDEVVSIIRHAANCGKRTCFINMNAIEYSVIPKLLMLDFDITDNGRGKMEVSW